jgi:cytochrome P450
VYRDLLGKIEHFDDPEAFDPERYLRHEYGIKEGVDPTFFRGNIAFGYGRVRRYA